MSIYNCILSCNLLLNWNIVSYTLFPKINFLNNEYLKVIYVFSGENLTWPISNWLGTKNKSSQRNSNEPSSKCISCSDSRCNLTSCSGSNVFNTAPPPSTRSYSTCWSATLILDLLHFTVSPFPSRPARGSPTFGSSQELRDDFIISRTESDLWPQLEFICIQIDGPSRTYLCDVLGGYLVKCNTSVAVLGLSMNNVENRRDTRLTLVFWY